MYKRTHSFYFPENDATIQCSRGNLAFANKAKGRDCIFVAGGDAFFLFFSKALSLLHRGCEFGGSRGKASFLFACFLFKLV